MVLVEVEVSEEEDEADENTSAERSITDECDKSVITEDINEETKEIVDDSNSVRINDIHNDSSLDQNDSRSLPFSSKNESEILSEQNSIQEGFESTHPLENQDSLQTENSTADVSEEKTFDVTVLNNDSQTQCKPDEKDGEVDNRNGVSFISVRSVSSLFDSSDTNNKKENSEGHEPLKTETIKHEIKTEPKSEEVPKVDSVSKLQDDSTSVEHIKQDLKEVEKMDVEDSELKDKNHAELKRKKEKTVFILSFFQSLFNRIGAIIVKKSVKFSHI